MGFYAYFQSFLVVFGGFWISINVKGAILDVSRRFSTLLNVSSAFLNASQRFQCVSQHFSMFLVRFWTFLVHFWRSIKILDIHKRLWLWGLMGTERAGDQINQLSANSTWGKRRLQKFTMNLTYSNKLWKKLQAFEKRKVYIASN